MKILSKETVAKEFEHKVKSIICDHNKCQKEIAMDENYYEVRIDRDDGEQGYVETMHFCKECAKLVLPILVDELGFLQDLEVTCYRRYDRETEKVSHLDEERGYFYEGSMRFED